jgi:hypothetical protein
MATETVSSIRALRCGSGGNNIRICGRVNNFSIVVHIVAIVAQYRLLVIIRGLLSFRLLAV